MYSARLLLPTVLILVPFPAPSQEMDADDFEPWKSVFAAKTSQIRGKRAQTAGQTTNHPAPRQVVDTVRDEASKPEAARAEPSEEFVPIIRVGAGAAYLVSIRPGDIALSEKVMTEFTASWCPFGAVGEIGFDLALARDNTFFARPNLKLFFYRENDYSFFLEGNLSIYSHAAGIEWGGGGGLGTVVGIVDNVAVEMFVCAMAFSMSAAGADSLVDEGFLETEGDGSGLIVIPYVGARLVARF
jgi:hypothetical protein